ncbi:adhesion G protein-coupled receptor L2-like isoform X2 [Asterias amurensis]|uniref:adhesion G protein-coupled receptor L2-like isoform X2 n=1 Tax=Asterias amurensis TaxID=7602 RepID=UPI003AB7C138
MAAWPTRGRIFTMKEVCWFLLVLCMVQQQVGGVPTNKRQKRVAQNTLYSSVCEGKTMDLRCPPGLQILIESANFGRTDAETCPRANTKNTNCIEPLSFDIVSQNCNNATHCTIPVIVDVFGDPCPKIFKFLEVRLWCLPQPVDETTTPPTTTHAPAATTAPTRAPTTTRLVTTEPAPTTLQATTTVTTTMTPATTVSPTTKEELIETTTMNLDFCAATNQRGVNWPRTQTNKLSIQPCPKGTSGAVNARWHCLGRPAKWVPETGPDLSLCTSAWAEDIKKQSSNTSATDLSDVMATAVGSNNEVYGGDLLIVTDLMNGAVGNLKQELVGLNKTAQFDMAKKVTQNYVTIGSSVLQDSNLLSWQDLPGSEKAKTATNLLTSIEEMGFVLADNLGPDDTLTSEEGNVVLEVIVQDTSTGDFEEVMFPRPSQLISNDWQDVTDSISIPKASLIERSKDGQAKVVFLAYKNLGSLLDSNEYNDADTSADYIINSNVISATIGDPQEASSLPEPAVIVFQHAAENLTSPMCSYWKFKADAPGEWSNTGCTLVSTNSTHTVCSCTHLTNFAILMNTKGVYIPRAHHFVLSVITYAGFIISCVCLLIAFLTFFYFKNLQNDRNTIHKNLCLCLLIAEIVFMAGIDQSSRTAMCTVVALFLHYFFLAAFAWMCLEGIQLYVMLVEVFEAESSRRKYYYPFGYGLPLLVVGIAAAIDISSYGTDEYCWLAVENNFIWAFVAPVVVIIIVNTMFLSMAILIMCRHSTMQTNQKEKTNKEKITEPNYGSSQQIVLGESNLEVAASWVRGALVLLCLLGITWAFGLLYVTESLLAFAYIFTIANAFQGVFIFVFHCFMNEKVIKEYRRYIRNSTWMPDCIRDRYGATFFTGSNQHRSSSSSGKRRIWSNEEKRLSNTTGSCSVDQGNRKLSTSSNGRNSGEYVTVKYNPANKGGNPRLSDEGIGLELEDAHMEMAQEAANSSDSQQSTPTPIPRRTHSSSNSPASPNEIRPLLQSPTEPPVYKQPPPPPSKQQQQQKSGNFRSLPDLLNVESDDGGQHPNVTKKSSLPDLPRSPKVPKKKVARMNSDSKKVGQWSPLEEYRPNDEDAADSNSGVEFLGISNLSPRRETLI